MRRPLGIIAVLWGAAGVFALLVSAIWRLGEKATHAFEHDLGAGHWLVLGALFAFMGYSEGYRGFQQKFSPRTAARLRWLRDHPTPMRTLFAPFFTMGFFHATRRTRVVAWILPFGILGLVLLVRLLPQPWRGLVDASVVFGLSWGVASLAVFAIFALGRERGIAASPEVPEPAEPDAPARGETKPRTADRPPCDITRSRPV